MPSLNDQPGTSTTAQRKALAMAARKAGFPIEQLRDLVGSKLHALSARDASKWIKHFGGGDLPNPPGQAPRPPKRKRQPGVIRMIGKDHIDQIMRLGMQYFGRSIPLSLWLAKNFSEIRVHPQRSRYDCECALWQLATAERAGQVIRVLKDMIARRAEPQASACAKAPNPEEPSNANA